MSETILLDRGKQVPELSEIKEIRKRTINDEDSAFLIQLSDFIESKAQVSFVEENVFEAEDEEILIQTTPKYSDFDVILTEEEEGGFSIECPELPGCISQGETEEEAIGNIKNAIEVYLECVERNKIQIAELKQITKIERV